MKENNLTIKQERFCNEVVKTGNLSEAYRIAYNAENMTSKSINEKASELNSRVKIKSRIKELQEEVIIDTKISVKWVVDKLVEVVEADDKDRVQALDKLMKHLGGYEKDNTQSKATVTNLINLGVGEEPETDK